VLTPVLSFLSSDPLYKEGVESETIKSSTVLGTDRVQCNNTSRQSCSNKLIRTETETRRWIHTAATDVTLPTQCQRLPCHTATTTTILQLENDSSFNRVNAWVNTFTHALTCY